MLVRFIFNRYSATGLIREFEFVSFFRDREIRSVIIILLEVKWMVYTMSNIKYHYALVKDLRTQGEVKIRSDKIWMLEAGEEGQMKRHSFDFSQYSMHKETIELCMVVKTNVHRIVILEIDDTPKGLNFKCAARGNLDEAEQVEAPAVTFIPLSAFRTKPSAKKQADKSKISTPKTTVRNPPSKQGENANILAKAKKMDSKQHKSPVTGDSGLAEKASQQPTAETSRTADSVKCTPMERQKTGKSQSDEGSTEVKEQSSTTLEKAKKVDSKLPETPATGSSSLVEKATQPSAEPLSSSADSVESTHIERQKTHSSQSDEESTEVKEQSSTILDTESTSIDSVSQYVTIIPSPESGEVEIDLTESSDGPHSHGNTRPMDVSWIKSSGSPESSAWTSNNLMSSSIPSTSGCSRSSTQSLYGLGSASLSSRVYPNQFLQLQYGQQNFRGHFLAQEDASSNETIEKLRRERDELKEENARLQSQVNILIQNSTVVPETLNHIKRVVESAFSNMNSRSETTANLDSLKFAVSLEEDFADINLAPDDIYVGYGRTVSRAKVKKIELKYLLFSQRAEQVFELITGGLENYRLTAKNGFLAFDLVDVEAVKSIVSCMYFSDGFKVTPQDMKEFCKKQPNEVLRRKKRKSESASTEPKKLQKTASDHDSD